MSAAADESLRRALSIDAEARVPNIARTAIMLAAGKTEDALGVSQALVGRYPTTPDPGLYTVMFCTRLGVSSRQSPPIPRPYSAILI